MIIISVARGADEGRVFKLPEDEPIRIGRRTGDVPLDDTRVSKDHAEIRLENGELVIEDLNSSNGTYLNRRLVRKPTPINDGDRIRLGRTKLLFTTTAGAAARQEDEDAAFDISDLAQIDDESEGSAVEMTVDAESSDAVDLGGALVKIQRRLDAIAKQSESEDILHDILQKLDERATTHVDEKADDRLDTVVQQVERLASQPTTQSLIDDLRETLQTELAKVAPSSEMDEATAQRLDAIVESIEQHGQRQRELEAKIAEALEATQASAVDPKTLADDIRQAVADASPDLQGKLDELAERIDAAQAPRDDASRLDSIVEQVESLSSDERDAALVERIVAALPKSKTDKKVRDALDALLKKADAEPADDPRIGQILEAVSADRTDDVAELNATLDALLEKVNAEPADDPRIGQILEAVSTERTDDIAELKATLDALLERANAAPADDPRIGQILEAVSAAPTDDVADLKTTLDAALEKLDALSAAQAERDDTQRVLDAIAALPEPVTAAQIETLTAKLDLLQAAQENNDTDQPVIEAVREAGEQSAARIEQAIQDLREQIAAQAEADASAEDDDAQSMLLNSVLTRVEQLASPQHQAQLVEAVRQAVEAEQAGDASADEIRQKLDDLIERMPDDSAGRDANDKLDLLIEKAAAEAKLVAVFDERMTDLLAKVEQSSGDTQRDQIIEAVRQAVGEQLNSQDDSAEREAALAERLDAILEAVTAPPAEATPDPRIDALQTTLADVAAKLDASGNQQGQTSGEGLAALLAPLREAVEALQAQQGQINDRLAQTPTQASQDEALKRVTEAVEASTTLQTELRSNPPADDQTAELLEQVLEAVTEPKTESANPDLAAKLDQLNERLQNLSPPSADDSNGKQAERTLELLQSIHDRLGAEDRLDNVLEAVTSPQDEKVAERLAALESKLAELPTAEEQQDALADIAQRLQSSDAPADQSALLEQIRDMVAPRGESNLEAMLQQVLGAVNDKSDESATRHTLQQIVTALRTQQKVQRQTFAALEQLADATGTKLDLPKPKSTQLDDVPEPSEPAAPRAAPESLAESAPDMSEAAAIGSIFTSSPQDLTRWQRLTHRAQQQPIAAALLLVGVVAFIVIMYMVITDTMFDRSGGDTDGGLANAKADDKQDGTDPDGRSRSAADLLKGMGQQNGSRTNVTPVGTNPGAADLSSIKRAVFILDISGLEPADARRALEAVDAPLMKLQPTQQVTLMVINGDSLEEAPPTGLKAASAEVQRQLRRWADGYAQSARAEEVGKPSVAINHATTQYDPDLIWIFSANVAGDHPRQMKPGVLLELLDYLNDSRSIRINTTQLFKIDPQGTLRKIADQHGGAYSFYTRQADQSPTPNGATQSGANPRTRIWLDPASTVGDQLDADRSRDLALQRKQQHGPEDPRTLEAEVQWAVALHREGQLAQAQALLTRVLTTLNRVQGRSHTQTLDAKQHLAMVLSDLRRPQEAEPHLRQVLSVHRQRLGDTHDLTLITFTMLGEVLSAQGKLPEAERYLRSVYDARRREDGADHRKTLLAQVALADVLEARGELKDCEQMRRDVLDVWRQKFGAADPGTLERSLELSKLLRFKVGKLAEADALTTAVTAALTRSDNPAGDPGLLERRASQLNTDSKHAESLALHDSAIRLCVMAFGDDHRQTARWRGAKAELLIELDRNGEARRLLKDVLASQIKGVGVHAEDTQRTRANLVKLLRHMEALPDAAMLQHDVVVGYRETRGINDEKTLAAIVELAELFTMQQKLRQALDLHRSVLTARRLSLGDGDPATLVSMNTVAGLLSRLGKPDEALAMQQQAVDAAVAAQGEEDPATLASMHLLGIAQRAQGKPTEAQATLQRVLDLRIKVLKEDHADTLATRVALASVLKQLGKFDEATPHYRKLVEAKSEQLSDTNEDTLALKVDLAVCLHQTADDAEAQPLLEQVVSVRRNVLGDHDRKTLSALSTLAVVLESQDKLNEAKAKRQLVHALCRAHLGERDPWSVAATHRYALVLEKLEQQQQAEQMLREAVVGYHAVATGQNIDPEFVAMLREGVAACKRVLGSTHPDTLRSQSLLTTVLEQR